MILLKNIVYGLLASIFYPSIGSSRSMLLYSLWLLAFWCFCRGVRQVFVFYIFQQLSLEKTLNMYSGNGAAPADDYNEVRTEVKNKKKFVP